MYHSKTLKKLPWCHDVNPRGSWQFFPIFLSMCGAPDSRRRPSDELNCFLLPFPVGHLEAFHFPLNVLTRGLESEISLICFPSSREENRAGSDWDGHRVGPVLHVSQGWMSSLSNQASVDTWHNITLCFPQESPESLSRVFTNKFYAATWFGFDCCDTTS